MEALAHSLFTVELFNKLFSKPAAALLKLFGIQVADPNHLFPDYLAVCILVSIMIVLLFGLSSRRFKTIPSRYQSFLESVINIFEGQVVDIIGEEGKKYVPMIATIGLFVFFNNLIGLVPGFMSPTSNLNVTLGCALTVFVYYHLQGIKTQGLLKYLKHFMGPIPLLAPLLIPIEIISHFSRPISLSIRLFGNIFAEELLILIMASIIPYFLPLPFMAIAIFTGLIQSFVFVLLSCIYISGAVAHEEEQE
ncbi:MAG: F0F1 ATP synthase subunit A [Candidatus Aminicenantes bacterium]|nr:F0F1 ATP synthase subunit A [Candidatus Aminicenantes bacterium]